MSANVGVHPTLYAIANEGEKKNMSLRKKILKELYTFYEEKGPDSYVLADTLKSFSPGNEKFLAAVSGLLRKELIKGVASGIKAEGSTQDRLAIAINPAKIREIKKFVIGMKTPNFG